MVLLLDNLVMMPQHTCNFEIPLAPFDGPVLFDGVGPEFLIQFPALPVFVKVPIL